MSSGERSKTVTAQSSPYTEEQQQWISKALNIYGPTLGQGQVSYPGERLAPFTTGQQQVLSALPDWQEYFAAQRDVPLFGETGEALKGTLVGQTGAKSITPEQTAQFFKTAYEEPSKRYLTKEILPATREAFAGPGFWGKARSKAQQEASEDLFANLAAQRGQLEWDVAEANRQIAENKAARSLAAVSPAMEYAALPVQQASARLAGMASLFDFMDVEKQQAQAEIQNEILKFVEEQQITDPQNLSILLSLLGQPYGGTTQSQAVSPGSWHTEDWSRFGAGAASSILGSILGG